MASSLQAASPGCPTALGMDGCAAQFLAFIAFALTVLLHMVWLRPASFANEVFGYGPFSCLRRAVHRCRREPAVTALALSPTAQHDVETQTEHILQLVPPPFPHATLEESDIEEGSASSSASDEEVRVPPLVARAVLVVSVFQDDSVLWPQAYADPATFALQHFPYALRVLSVRIGAWPCINANIGNHYVVIRVQVPVGHVFDALVQSGKLGLNVALPQELRVGSSRHTRVHWTQRPAWGTLPNDWSDVTRLLQEETVCGYLRHPDGRYGVRILVLPALSAHSPWITLYVQWQRDQARPLFCRPTCSVLTLCHMARIWSKTPPWRDLEIRANGVLLPVHDEHALLWQLGLRSGCLVTVTAEPDETS